MPHCNTLQHTATRCNTHTDPDADNINGSPLLGTWGSRFGVPFLKQLFLSAGDEQMLHARVSKTPSFFIFVFMIAWAAFEIVMRYDLKLHMHI